MSRRKQAQGRTTLSGLGWKHQQAREDALSVLIDGTPCPKCGQGMYRTQSLDLDHVIPRALGGIDGVTRLTHAHCNRSTGGRLGNRMKGKRGRGRRPQKPKQRYPQW